MDRNTIPQTGKPASGEKLVVEVETMGAEAMGIAHRDGLAVLIPRGLPGERVEVTVDSLHPRYVVGRCDAVLEPSPVRVEPACGDFGRCGGCDWQHAAYAAQLEFKRRVVEDQLLRIGGIVPPPDWEIVPSPQELEYRERLDFLTVRQQGLLLPGFHGVETGARVSISRCHLAPATFTELARFTLEILSATETDGGTQGPTRVTVQSAAEAEDPAGLAVTLHFTHPAAAERLAAEPGKLLDPLVRAFPQLKVVALSVKARNRGNSAAEWRILKGGPNFRKIVGGKSYSVPLAGFFQVNLPQAERLVAEVTGILAEALPLPPASAEAPWVFDLFCGVGLFTLPLAELGYRVVGLEREQRAVRAARQTARDWRVARCRFHTADLARPGVFEAAVANHGRPGFVLVNPPRRGLPTGLADSLLREGPPLLLYVSCDGGTFARDVARLAPHYRLQFLRGFDLFPQTHHLELLAVFRREISESFQTRKK